MDNYVDMNMHKGDILYRGEPNGTEYFTTLDAVEGSGCNATTESFNSMNSAGRRCHDNARCESVWERMKNELFYSRDDKSENCTIDEQKNVNIAA